MNTADVVTVTTRNRNLGYAWTNQPVRKYSPSGRDYLGFTLPDQPQVTGGPRAIRQARRAAQRTNQGNDWAEAVYVGGRRVVAVDGLTGWEVRDFLTALDRAAGTANLRTRFEVTLAPPAGEE